MVEGQTAPTLDVCNIGADENIGFQDLPIHKSIVSALKLNGFDKPSPIQLKAIPLALYGSDVVAQSKSGTGKTIVFAVVAVQSVFSSLKSRLDNGQCAVQVLILAPTREIAMQIRDVIRLIAMDLVPFVSCHATIGGISIEKDQKTIRDGCSILVGTPGRVCALLDKKILAPERIQLFVMDEVDKLLAKDFLPQIRAIAKVLPVRKQVLVLSATLSPSIINQISGMMRSPQFVRTCGIHDSVVERVLPRQIADVENKDLQKPELWLHGVAQYYTIISVENYSSTSIMRKKVSKLGEILSTISFDQCIVFSNDKTSAVAIASALQTLGWPSASITGSLPQVDRLQAIQSFRTYATRVLVSTDLTARGIDVRRVNLVINLDLPPEAATYLHRVGRTGRFGTFGIAINFVTKKDMKNIHALGALFDVTIAELPAKLSATFRDQSVARMQNNLKIPELQLEAELPIESQTTEQYEKSYDGNEQLEIVEVQQVVKERSLEGHNDKSILTSPSLEVNDHFLSVDTSCQSFDKLLHDQSSPSRRQLTSNFDRFTYENDMYLQWVKNIRP